MIPTGKWSCITKQKQFVRNTLPLPPVRYTSVYDINTGPMELSASAGNLTARMWMVYQIGASVFIRGALNQVTWREPIELFTEAGEISDISLTFDSLGRPAVFYQIGTTLTYWFFDSQLSTTTKKVITTNGKTPVAAFDYVTDTSNAESDMLIFYVVNDTAYMRMQRDRFVSEINTGVSLPKLELTGRGVTRDNRFQVTYKFRDLRDGGLTTKKCLETDHPLLTQLQNNELEIGFVIAKAPSWCELRKLYETYPIGWAGRFCVVGHSGNHYISGHPQEEHLFSVEFMFDDITNDTSPIYLIIRRTAFSDGIYLTATLPHTVFTTTGEFKLKFLQDPPALGDVPQKRIILEKDGVVLVNNVVYDAASDIGQWTGTRNCLRFGAQTEANTATYTQYKFLYPAVFTNIYAIVNGVRTDWPKLYSDKVVASVPTGNTLRLRRPADTSYDFKLGT